MTRKMLTAAIAVTALLLSVFSLSMSPAAEAGNDCDYFKTIAATTVPGVTPFGVPPVCEKAIAYPGPFTTMPPAPVGAYGWGHANVVAGAGAAAGTGGGDAAAPLAHTGSESTVLGYVGTGLIAFGAVALGSRRKFFQGALED